MIKQEVWDSRFLVIPVLVMIYFTSDLHLGHRHIIDAAGRPFSNVESMNETLIANINNNIQFDDQLYILGDLCHRISKSKANHLISRIQCKKILIKGNHDQNYDPTLFEAVYDCYEIMYKGLPFILVHSPVFSLPSNCQDSILLHGHMHNPMTYNTTNRDRGLKHYDVGVDAHDYRPVSIREICEFFA